MVYLITVQGQGPLVTLDNEMGTLEGMVKQTLGANGNTPKDYYHFTNIQYAHSVSGENRYKVSSLTTIT